MRLGTHQPFCLISNQHVAQPTSSGAPSRSRTSSTPHDILNEASPNRSLLGYRTCNIVNLTGHHMDALTHTSSSVSVYDVCATYHNLYSLRHLRSIAKLLSCITSHNHTYKFDNIDAAFNDHRILTIDPDERQRRRKQRCLALVEERDSLRAQLQQQKQQPLPPLPPPPPPSPPPIPTPQSQQEPELQQDEPVSSTSVSSPSTESFLSSSRTTDRDRVLHLEGVVAQLSHQLTQLCYRDTLQLQRHKTTRTM